jgi:hypothetical protein
VHAGVQCVVQGPAAVAAVADMSEFTWSRISWQAVQTAFQPPVVIKRVEDPRLARLANSRAQPDSDDEEPAARHRRAVVVRWGAPWLLAAVNLRQSRPVVALSVCRRMST